MSTQTMTADEIYTAAADASEAQYNAGMETFNNWPIYNCRPSDRVMDALGLYAAALGAADNGGGCFEDVPDALRALNAAIRTDYAESEAAAMRAFRGGA